jgi:hypothetical protein
MPGTRTENLAADYFAAKRLRELTEVDELIVASVSQLTYDLSVHLENSSSCPGRRHRLGLFVCKFEFTFRADFGSIHSRRSAYAPLTTSAACHDSPGFAGSARLDQLQLRAASDVVAQHSLVSCAT